MNIVGQKGLPSRTHMAVVALSLETPFRFTCKKLSSYRSSWIGAERGGGERSNEKREGGRREEKGEKRVRERGNDGHGTGDTELHPVFFCLFLN